MLLLQGRERGAAGARGVPRPPLRRLPPRHQTQNSTFQVQASS